MRKLIVPLAALVMLSGCAKIMWDKPGVTQQQFTAENAQCQLMAQGSVPPAEAADIHTGSWKKDAAADAGADLAAGIVRGIAVRENYKLCMQAKGYTEQSPQAQAANAQLKPAIADYTACIAASYNAPEMEPIRRHAPFSTNDLTATQLADTALATDQEITAIDLFHAKVDSCRQNRSHAISVTAPSAVPSWQTFVAESEGDLSALKARKMTWGEFNTHRRDHGHQLQEQINVALQQQGSGAANPSTASAVGTAGHCGGDIHSPEAGCKGQ